jgi:hypothetical protein
MSNTTLIVVLMALIIAGIGAVVAFGGGMSGLKADVPGDEGSIQEEAREVSWEQVVFHIERCEAAMVFQTHALDVYVNLKDGSRVHAKEPTIDDVFRVLDQTRDECGIIPVATE